MLVMPHPPTLFALGIFLLAFALCCWHEEYTKKKNKIAADKLIRKKQRHVAGQILQEYDCEEDSNH